MRSLIGRFATLFAENGVLLGTFLLCRRTTTRIRSRILGYSLNARGLELGPGCEIRGARYIAIGDYFSCKGGLWLEAVPRYRGQEYKPSIKIGREVTCSQHVHISCIGAITVGDQVLIGSGVYIGDHNHGEYRGVGASSPDSPPAHRALSTRGPLIIEDRVFLGDKVTVLGGLKIGYGTIVAANSVVTQSLPPMCIAAGSPARVVRRFDAATSSWLSTNT